MDVAVQSLVYHDRHAFAVADLAFWPIVREDERRFPRANDEASDLTA